MRFSKRLSFRGQMVLAVLLAATLPMLISMEITQRVASDKLYEQAFAALSAQRDLHRQKVEESLEEARTFVTSLSENLMVISALRSFTAEVGHLLEDLPPTTDELASMREELQVFYREKLGDNMGGSSAIPADPFGLLAQYHVLAKNPKPVGHKHETAEFNELGTYGAMHTQYHASLISIVNRYNYRDLFLIDKNGTVVYSAMKQRDYATNIISGAMRDTGLGRVAREALATTAPDKVFIDDFELYSGSGDTPAAFLSAPVVDGFNRKLGAVVIQLHADHFSRVLERGMSHRKTGDIVLVGSDAKLRSASHLDPQGGMLSTAAVGAALNEALAGKSGVIEIFDASGAEIHASYSPLDLPGLRWTIIASEAHSEAMGMIGYLRMLGWIMSAITVLIAIVVAVTQARSVKRQLGGEPGCLVQMAERMSAGDFVNAGRSDIATNSGAVRALTDMKTRLSQTIMNIRSAAGNVESGSREIANGNLNLSQRTEEQANHLQETASSMRRMTDSVKQNAANANQANSLASGARQTAERGVEVVQKTVAAMNAISESSRKITDITSVIDEIAFQTNLLALNAAVEAAHAGEQGRGFAVVANEVRNLAQRSAGAAREIKQLIEDSAGKVDAGTRLVNESGDSLQEIVASVRSVSDIVSGIANASQQQLAGIEQVGVSIHGMDEMTQQNAELVEQVAAASESMGVEAKKLSELITFFKLDAESKGAPRSAGTQHSMPRTSAAKGVVQGERSAAYAGPERRAASRPWSNSSGAAPVLPKSKPVTRAKNANGTLDSSWTEF